MCVQGQLDRTWADWFDGMTIEVIHRPEGKTRTILSGVVADQTALRGMLIKLWDLNLALLSVEQVQEEG
ncbi:MAG: hypothetical protein JW934_01375 [Anaerolineae bacterium]|nr:hypothetical protein [Anaerolineae bacterium]